MRFKLIFKLENNFISVQYRKNILSFIKLSLKEYDENYYNKFYHEKDNIIKPYTFAVYLKNAKFNSETIEVSDKTLILNISIANIEDSIIFYNAFNNQRNKKIPMNQNSMTLIIIEMLKEKKVQENDISIKFMSPLVVHYREPETRKDRFYSFEDSEFIEILKLNIKNQIKEIGMDEKVIDNFILIPIQAKKSVVSFYEKKIEVSLGTFKMCGERQLLEYLYRAGIGSKHSAGFGMFEII